MAGQCIADMLLKEYPNGDIPSEDVRRVLSPVMKQVHILVSNAVNTMINAQYARDGIGLKAVTPEYGTHRENNLAEKISAASYKQVEENG